MALRVTQQSVDVLSEATGGKIRVTQFYVEVLGTQGASLSVSQSLGITDAATEILGGSFNVSASSAMSLSDLASPLIVYSRAASNAMTLSDLASAATVRSLSASSVLAFAQDSFIGTPVAASSALALTDQVRQVFTQTVSSAMALSDLAHESPILLDVSSSMPLSHAAISSLKLFSVSSVLALTDLAKTDRHAASNIMTLTDSVSTSIKPVAAANAILLSDSATRVLVHIVASVLALTDDAERMAVFKRALASNFGPVQAVEIDIDRAGELCNYAPSVGSGPFTISNVPPTLTPGTLTLFWPVVSPSLTVVLRNPEFGNKIAFNANRINRKSRGGTVQVFRKETWPKFRMLTMNMSVLTTTQANAFKSFLNSTLGLQIGLTDHEGRTWKGIISTPDTDITQIGPGACGNYATSFQFEGELA